MNKEIEGLLKYLKNNTYIPDETKRKYKILHRDEVKLLLSYIEQLEKENQCKYRNRCDDIYECSYAEYEDMCNKNMEMALKIEQLENNRDKALRIIDKYKETYIICFDKEQWNFVKRLEKCLQRNDK